MQQQQQRPPRIILILLSQATPLILRFRAGPTSFLGRGAARVIIAGDVDGCGLHGEQRCQHAIIERYAQRTAHASTRQNQPSVQSLYAVHTSTVC